MSRDGWGCFSVLFMFVLLVPATLNSVPEDPNVCVLGGSGRGWGWLSIPVLPSLC